MGATAFSSSRFFCGLAIFSSAFLLFQLQPILGKRILPWFGGAGAVWIVCLLFFQIVLLLGYLYAHFLTEAFRPLTQGRIHAALLVASVLALPILPKDPGRFSLRFGPALEILWVLAIHAGLPYFLLSSTSPLLQAWSAQNRADRTLYRFYAVSNAGSMLALVSYPFLVEPWVSTPHQAVGWSFAYGTLALVLAARALSRPAGLPPLVLPEPAPFPDRMTRILWGSLAACGSALLLAVTSHLSRNIAPVPLLWMIPLALYLLSFILCFERPGWYHRALFLRLLGAALGAMAYSLGGSFSILPLPLCLLLYCSGLWVCCMFCHGELARLKPHPAHLTSFYLIGSLGGAVGALLVALAAPWLFSGNYELQIAMGACAVLVLVVYARDPESPFYRARFHSPWLVMAGLALALIAGLAMTAREEARSAQVMLRNFYGTLRVIEQVAPRRLLPGGEASQRPAPDLRYRKLMNGTIDHGLQFVSPARRRQATSYYGPVSGIGIALRAARAARPVRAGVIGLGAGTLATYGRAGDQYRFYELNPLVIEVANREFTFLKDSEARTETVPGDARRSLELESPQSFDVLAVDAFTSDSIPVHLLTRQAFELYFRHLKADGVLAVHISNQFLNLTPVLAGAAARLGKEAVLVASEPDSEQGIYRSTWVLLGSREGFLGKQEIERAGTLLDSGSRKVDWTDDYSSLLELFR